MLKFIHAKLSFQHFVNFVNEINNIKPLGFYGFGSIYGKRGLTTLLI